jgi:hypothetical protein
MRVLMFSVTLGVVVLPVCLQAQSREDPNLTWARVGNLSMRVGDLHKQFWGHYEVQRFTEALDVSRQLVATGHRLSMTIGNPPVTQYATPTDVCGLNEMQLEGAFKAAAEVFADEGELPIVGSLRHLTPKRGNHNVLLACAHMVGSQTQIQREALEFNRVAGPVPEIERMIRLLARANYISVVCLEAYALEAVWESCRQPGWRYPLLPAYP